MKASRLKTALLGSGAAVVLMAAASPASADDISDLRKQVNAMQEKIAKLEADKTAAAHKRNVAAAAAVEAGDKPRSWKLPGTNTSMSIGGYVKMDILWDFGSRTGPTTGQGFVNGNNAGNNRTNGGAFQFQSRQSRFYIRTWTPTDWGELATHFEGDFYGLTTGTDVAPLFRLRHAYGRLGPVLAGQTWTTWMPVFAGPELLDFGGPVSAIFVRQPQVRYTQNFGGGFFMDFAVENPIRRGYPPPFNGNANASGNGPTFLDLNSAAGVAANQGANQIPDFVVTAYYNMPRGRLWLGGLFRQLKYDTGTGQGADSTFGWGVALAGAFRVTKKIRMGFQGVIGRGVYSYFNGGAFDAVVQNTTDNQGNLDAVLIYGGYIWGQYRWTDTIRSTVSWSYWKQDLNGSLPGGVNANTIGGIESVQQVFVNLIWSPVPQVNIGAEYSFFQQNNYAGANYTGNRLQISFQYSF